MAEHRWSGWPGAWCMDCGAEDKREICSGTCEWPACPQNHPEGENCDDCPVCRGTGCVPCQKPECMNGPCPEPGSNRHNPYEGRNSANVKRTD